MGKHAMQKVRASRSSSLLPGTVLRVSVQVSYRLEDTILKSVLETFKGII